MAVLLVAEDDETVRVLAQSVIEGMGHVGLTAANADEALALLSADRNVSLLFTDLDMGDDPLAGIELAVQARSKRPNIAVIYTSGAGVTDGTRALFVDGANFLRQALHSRAASGCYRSGAEDPNGPKPK